MTLTIFDQLFPSTFIPWKSNYTTSEKTSCSFSNVYFWRFNWKSCMLDSVLIYLDKKPNISITMVPDISKEV